MNDELRTKIAMLPESPGCYLMKHQGEIIYVGKAVNLKNRVRSYFMQKEHTPKVAAMVGRIDDFDIILCEGNLEALMLECNLIKLHKPYYNILLKDDKHYPYIRINEREPFPKVEMVRRMQKDGARYYGPYIGANAVRDVLEVLRRTFPLRTCSRPPDPQKPRRPCVHYEIGQCLAPCAGKVTQQQYAAVVRDVEAFLSGKSADVIKKLREQMMEASREMQFEKAAMLRDRIREAEGLLERQLTLSPSGGERDVIGVAVDGLDAMCEVLHVRGGKMIGGDSFALERAGDEPADVILAEFIMQYYEDGRMVPREVLAQALPEEAQELERALEKRRGASVRLHCPQRGGKRALVLLAEKNARDALEKRNAKAKASYERTLGAAAALAEAIGMSKPPRRIEGFDISNTQGAQSVASMVVFIDGKPARKEYRHYRIKTVVGPNDFASMEEVLSRRFRRGLAERETNSRSGFGDLPDLVLIDGGPEQLAFARRAMHAAGADVPMFGLAKRLEEIWLPQAKTPILLDRHSPALYLIQSIRDEAHRFAITFHRRLRSKQTVRSQLEEISGIGKKRRVALFKRFGSLEAVKRASVEELMQAEGMTAPAAEAVYRWARAQEEKKAARTQSAPGQGGEHGTL